MIVVAVTALVSLVGGMILAIGVMILFFRPRIIAAVASRGPVTSPQAVPSTRQRLLSAASIFMIVVGIFAMLMGAAILAIGIPALW